MTDLAIMALVLVTVIVVLTVLTAIALAAGGREAPHQLSDRHNLSTMPKAVDGEQPPTDHGELPERQHHPHPSA